MRSYATWPLVVLSVWPGRVTLRSSLLRWVGGDSLDATPGDVTDVVPARGRFGSDGVGFRLLDGRRFFFWTGQSDRVLKLLAEQGFSVGTEERSETDW